MSAAAAVSSRRVSLKKADHAAAHPLGERGQIGLGDRSGRQERRRGVAPRAVGRRHEDAFGCAYVQVHVVVERRAEAVQEGHGAEPWASGCGGAGVTRHACDSAQQPLDLLNEDSCESGDGRRPIGEKTP
jgi:hypothetical protein